MTGHRSISILVGAVIFVIFVAFLVWRLAFLSTQPRLYKDLSLRMTPPESIALSPDGSLLAYSAPYGDGTRLHLRRLEDGVVSRPEGTEGAERPFFSPDGRKVGFYVGDRVRTLELEEAEPAIEAPSREGWIYVERDGTIVASARDRDEEHVVVSDARRPRIVEPGFLLFLRDGALWAVGLDARDAELTSEPFLVVENVDGWYDVSANGTLAVRRAGEGPRRRFRLILNWLGELERLAEGRAFRHPGGHW